ncbi:hypothetical protein ACFSKN_08670 [Mariniflexile gromovii]
MVLLIAIVWSILYHEKSDLKQMKYMVNAKIDSWYTSSQENEY